MYRTLRWILVPVAMTIVLAACGKSSTTTATTVASTAATTATTTATPKTVKTTTDATLGTILVDSQGRTLYHNTKEKGSTIVCTATCATTWPPLTIPTGTTPTWSSDLAGDKFGTVTRPDGTLQVTFANWPLYTYSGDSGPGTTKGQGIGGIWFAITSAGVNAGAATGSSTTAGGSSTTGAAATTSTTYSY